MYQRLGVGMCGYCQQSVCFLPDCEAGLRLRAAVFFTGTLIWFSSHLRFCFLHVFYFWNKFAFRVHTVELRNR